MEGSTKETTSSSFADDSVKPQFTTSTLFSNWNMKKKKFVFVPRGRIASRDLEFSGANVAIKSFKG